MIEMASKKNGATQARRITQPPIRLYSFTGSAKKVSVIDPLGGTATDFTVHNEAEGGWYADVEAAFGGFHALVYDTDGEADLIKIPATPGSAFNVSDS